MLATWSLHTKTWLQAVKLIRPPRLPSMKDTGPSSFTYTLHDHNALWSGQSNTVLAEGNTHAYRKSATLHAFYARVGAAISVASTIYVCTTPTNSMSTHRVKNNNNNKTVFLLKLVQELVTLKTSYDVSVIVTILCILDTQYKQSKLPLINVGPVILLQLLIRHLQLSPTTPV